MKKLTLMTADELDVIEHKFATTEMFSKRLRFMTPDELRAAEIKLLTVKHCPTCGFQFIGGKCTECDTVVG